MDRCAIKFKYKVHIFKFFVAPIKKLKALIKHALILEDLHLFSYLLFG